MDTRHDYRLMRSPWGCAALVDDIDLDFTCYSRCLDMDYYLDNPGLILSMGKKYDKAFVTMASRGCPGNCSFCAISVIHGHRPRWRSMENILGEIEWLHSRYGVTRFHFYDDNFVPESRIIDLLGTLRNSRFFNKMEITFQHLSVNFSSEKTIDAIVDAGIKDITFAIETGDPEMQKSINKFCDLEKAAYLVRAAKDRGLIVRCFFMLGFPNETKEAMHRTVAFARELDVDWTSFSIVTPLPGTRMYDDFVVMGYLEDSPNSWNLCAFGKRVFDTAEIKAEELSELAFRAMLENNYVHVRLLREGRIDEAERLYLNITKVIPTQVFGFDVLRRIYRCKNDVSRMNDAISQMLRLVHTSDAGRSYLKYLDLLEPEIQELLRG